MQTSMALIMFKMIHIKFEIVLECQDSFDLKRSTATQCWRFNVEEFSCKKCQYKWQAWHVLAHVICIQAHGDIYIQLMINMHFNKSSNSCMEQIHPTITAIKMAKMHKNQAFYFFNTFHFPIYSELLVILLHQMKKQPVIYILVVICRFICERQDLV